jgi:adenylate cyclase
VTAGRAAQAARRVARWFGRGRLVALALLALLALAKLNEPALLRGLEMRGFDLLSQLFPREAPAESPIAIVDIDDDSLASLGQWPWPRTLIADLVDRLAQAGVAAVGFDVLFAEPDRLSPALIADRLPQLDDAARAELKQSPSNEQVLAAALGRTRAVLGLAAVSRPTNGVPPMPPTPVAALGEDPLLRAMSLTALLSPLPELAAAAQGGGLMTLLPELDGIVRRVPLVLNVGGKLYPALSVEMLRVGQGESTYVFRYNHYGIEQLIVGQFAVPTDSLGRV